MRAKVGGSRTGRALVLCAALAVMCAWSLAIAPGGAGAAAARVSLPAMERQLMCVTCKIPLNVAESPQADREKEYVRQLIGEGRDEAQIKNALVAQYGSAVLGLPGTSGFDLAAYLVPVAVVLGLLAVMAALLPRWRRRGAADAALPPRPALSSEQSARLDSDLARFD
jgi:cytochrome c-type biogenesis protein CcmH/NrfF